MLQLLVFDARRGNTEGQEDDKVLAWFPSGLPPAHQSGLAGLLHGLLLFTANFAAAAASGAAKRPHVDCVETDSGTWVMHEPEPHIWFATLAPQAWLPRHTTEHNLRSVLVQMHLLTTVLCGSVQAMLDQDPEGSLARLSLQAVLQQAGQQLCSQHSWQQRELRNPLMDASLPPLLALPPGISLAVQSLSNLALQALLSQRRPVAGVVLLYGPHLLWSSLPPRDTAALFALIATGLLHAPSSSSASGGGGGGSGGSGANSSSSAGVSGTAGGVARSDLRPLDGGAWQQLPSGFLVQRGGGVDGGGGRGSGSGEVEGGGMPAISVPVVYLQQHLPGSRQQHCGQQQQQAQQQEQQASGGEAGGEPGEGRLELAPYHLLPLLEGKLLVALVLGGGTRLVTTPLLGGLHALLAAPAKQLAAQIGEEIRLTRTEAAHLPGFRYLYQDTAQQVCRASPRIKVSAMSHHARTLAAAVRGSLGPLDPPSAGLAPGDGSWAAAPAVAGGAAAVAAAAGGQEAAGAAAGAGSSSSSSSRGDSSELAPAQAGGQGGGGSSQGGQGNHSHSGSAGCDLEVLEVLAKSSQDCWAAAWRPGGGRQLLAVRERRTEREAGEAGEVMQAFAAANFLI